ncbi:MAG: MobQ family relaxase [Steroidobacteraceae bacterium]
MAIYHLSVKPVSRGGGRSATAASAYRAAELVHDHTTGETFDYSRKRGVEHAEIVLPTEAAKADINWARDRQQLWNAAEEAENRSNSRVAREYEIALPHELTKAQRLELVRGFASEIANRHGVAVDFAIHAPHRSGDERNWHAHLLATTRVIEAQGLGEKASIEWSDTNRRQAELEPARKEIEAIRERWAALTNEKLLEHGHEIRIDHRSLDAQGIEREPTSHLGPAVSGMERRGIETEVGQRIERERALDAQRRIELAAEMGRLEREHSQVQLSILDLSGDLQAAKQARQHGLAKGSPTRELIAGMSVAQKLEVLSNQVAQRLEKEAALERTARFEEAAETERQRVLEKAPPALERERTLERSAGHALGDEDPEARQKAKARDYGMER